MLNKEITHKFLSRFPIFYSVLLVAALLVLGFLAGWWIRGSTQQADTNEQVAIRESGYRLVKPLLIGMVQNSYDQPFKSLEAKFREMKFNATNNPEVNAVSVYFLDLTSAHSMGIKEDDLYDSGSLLKVSILIAALKEAESQPGFLNKKVIYPYGAQDDQVQHNLKPGNAYTIEELLRFMIIQSDNPAKDLLFASVDRNFVNDVFVKLGLPVPDPNSQYKISARMYSYFFRVLYNSTYLHKKDSEWIMELLSQAAYKDGLVAGVPQDVTVAHKFGLDTGVSVGNGNNNVWELHDCGIVFHPDNPYFLCVMTRGQDLTQLTNVIKVTSQVIYQEVDKNFNN